MRDASKLFIKNETPNQRKRRLESNTKLAKLTQDRLDTLELTLPELRKLFPTSHK